MNLSTRSLRMVLGIWILLFVPSLLCEARGLQSGPFSGPAKSRSIRNWVHCDGKTDDDAGVIAAFAAAKDNAFTLVVDCPVFIHVGMDISHPIFIDNGTTVQFTKDGLFTVDNVFVPAFVIANSANVRLLDWRIQYVGGLPVDPNVKGYYDNGAFVQRQGYAQPSFAFNDQTLSRWLSAHRGIHFAQTGSLWWGPTDTSSLFYIIGATTNLEVQDFKLSVPAHARGSQFVPVVFASLVGYKSNENVTRQTPVTSEYCAIPSQVTFSGVSLDGYYMGWQGSFQNAVFEHISAYRYGDLQDANGGTPGGVGKWFAPPHLFYLNYNPKLTGLENRNIQVLDVTDYGQRVGVARDKEGEKASGFACSLKIGAINSVVDGYKSYRPDGLLDLLASDNLKISNVEGTYDSSFLNNLYQGMRFPQPPYNGVVLQNVNLTDKAPVTRVEPVGSSYNPASAGIAMKNVKVTLNNWSKAVPNNVMGAANFRAAVQPKAAITPCPHLPGNNSNRDIQFIVRGQVQKCN